MGWSLKAGVVPLARQFLSFACVGAIGTTAHYAVLIALVHFADAMPVVASVFGFVTGALVNYILNYRFTFRANSPHPETAAKFFTVALVGIFLNTLIMAVLTEYLSLHYLPAQVAATGTVLLWNFACNRLWTFPEKDDNAKR